MAEPGERGDDDVEPGSREVPDVPVQERLLAQRDEDRVGRLRHVRAGIVVDDGPVEAGALLVRVRQAGLLSEPAVEVPVGGRPGRLDVVRLELLALGPRDRPARRRLPHEPAADPLPDGGGYAVSFAPHRQYITGARSTIWRHRYWDWTETVLHRPQLADQAPMPEPYEQLPELLDHAPFGTLYEQEGRNCKG